MIRLAGLICSFLAILAALILVISFIVGKVTGNSASNQKRQETVVETETEDTESPVLQVSEAETETEEVRVLGTDDYVFHEEAMKDGQYYAVQTATSEDLSDDATLTSKYAILVNTETGNIVAYRNPYETAVPASMTKVLTTLVASEHIPESEMDTLTSIDLEISDYCYENGCSAAGLAPGEEVPVRDMFYCTVLPSGADGALGLAHYVAGSQEAFVELMNQKLDELDLSSSAHFTNCIGLYNEDHYCTVYDMAMIMEAALDDPWSREVLSTHQYTTKATDTNPNGIELSNLFLRRIEDLDIGGTILAAKTGYVEQSGNCAVSSMTSDQGTVYICVTIGAEGPWAAIYDHQYLYSAFATQ